MDNVNNKANEVQNDANGAAAAAHKMLSDCSQSGFRGPKSGAESAIHCSLDVTPLNYGGKGPAAAGESAAKSTPPAIVEDRLTRGNK